MKDRAGISGLRTGAFGTSCLFNESFVLTHTPPTQALINGSAVFS